MSSLDLVLQVAQILIAALVAVIPPFYPSHSLYTRRALHGIEMLRDTREIWDDGELEVGWVARGETGFSQLRNAIRREKGDAPKQVARIGLVYGGQSELKEFIGFNPGAWVGNNAVLFVEYTDEERIPVVFHPFDPRITLQLTELEQWIQNSANRRANYWAAGLAVTWTAVAVAATL